MHVHYLLFFTGIIRLPNASTCPPPPTRKLIRCGVRRTKEPVVTGIGFGRRLWLYGGDWGCAILVLGTSYCTETTAVVMWKRCDISKSSRTLWVKHVRSDIVRLVSFEHSAFIVCNYITELQFHYIISQN